MRYRLRSLLIVTVMVAAYFGGRASTSPQIRSLQQQLAIAEENRRVFEESYYEQVEVTKVYELREELRRKGHTPQPPVQYAPGEDPFGTR
jgi:hypothetical protein